MKRQITECFCDRCGKKMGHYGKGGWHIANETEFSFIGVKAMFSNCGVGSKYDLCDDCTVEICEEFVKAMKNRK